MTASLTDKEREAELQAFATSSKTVLGDTNTANPFLGYLPGERYAFAAAARSIGVSYRDASGFVGLQNQGATCYLNSLIQALYMTPEFRRAVLGWRYDEQRHGSPELCVPYALQRLFARLLMSRQSAVSTVELTQSFGWNQAESFRQHDVQELMRVLFNVLVHTLGEDPRTGFLRDLYEGTLEDFLLCHGCKQRRARSDIFLDVSLNIDKASSLDDALRSYVAPEILEGDNQYRCSTCEALQDASKGLTFTRLPNILSFQLARFVYDYQMGRRRKLYHRVSFPRRLDMSPYVPDADSDTPLLYDLFAVLRHSGSAHAGHYNAFIKDPEATEGARAAAVDAQLSKGDAQPEDDEDGDAHDVWFLFNDSTVTPIPTKDLSLAYGLGEPGDAAGKTGDGVAYMLMYRRAGSFVHVVPGADDDGGDGDGDAPAAAGAAAAAAVAVGGLAEMDEHLEAMVREEDAAWEEERARVAKELRMMDIDVLYGDQTWSDRIDCGETMGALLATVCGAVGVPENLVAQFRLRRYLYVTKQTSMPGEAYDDRPGNTLQELMLPKSVTFILEQRDPETGAFPEYDASKVVVRVILIDADNAARLVANSRAPILDASVPHVWVDTTAGTVGDLAAAIHAAMDIPVESQQLFQINHNRISELAAPDLLLSEARIGAGSVIYVDHTGGASGFLQTFEAQCCQIEICFNALDPEEAAARALADGPDAVEIPKPRAKDGTRPTRAPPPSYDLSITHSRMRSIADLKAAVASVLGIPVDQFVIRRRANGDELKDLSASLDEAQFTDGSILHLDYGRPLRPTEVRIHLVFYDPLHPKRALWPLFGITVDAANTVADIQDRILALMAEHYPNTKDPAHANRYRVTHMRLRTRLQKKVGRICRADHTLLQCLPHIADGQKMAIQRIHAPEIFTKNNRCIFIQQWHPESATLDVESRAEIVVQRTMRMHELAALIGSRANIPPQDVSVAKCPSMRGVTDARIRQRKGIRWSHIDWQVRDSMMISGPPLNLADGDFLLFRDRTIPDVDIQQQHNPDAPGKKRTARKHGAKAWDGTIDLVTSTGSSKRVMPREHALTINYVSVPAPSPSSDDDSATATTAATTTTTTPSPQDE